MSYHLVENQVNNPPDKSGELAALIIVEKIYFGFARTYLPKIIKTGSEKVKLEIFWGQGNILDQTRRMG